MAKLLKQPRALTKRRKQTQRENESTVCSKSLDVKEDNKLRDDLMDTNVMDTVRHRADKMQNGGQEGKRAGERAGRVVCSPAETGRRRLPREGEASRQGTDGGGHRQGERADRPEKEQPDKQRRASGIMWKEALTGR